MHFAQTNLWSPKFESNRGNSISRRVGVFESRDVPGLGVFLFSSENYPKGPEFSLKSLSPVGKFILLLCVDSQAFEHRNCLKILLFVLVIFSSQLAFFLCKLHSLMKANTTKERSAGLAAAAHFD